MAEFLYKATNSQGNNFEGSIEAKDKAEAEAMLMRRRLIIVSLKKKPTEIKIKIGSGIKPAEIARFTRMFSSMSSAGLPMLQCLNILENQCENPELKNVHEGCLQVLDFIVGYVRGGKIRRSGCYAGTCHACNADGKG